MAVGCRLQAKDVRPKEDEVWGSHVGARGLEMELGVPTKTEEGDGLLGVCWAAVDGGRIEGKL